LLLAAIVTVAHAGQATDTNVLPPNILLIVLDDFGYNDLGANGNPNTPTPYLDALAAQGIRYARHDADATCSVARAALMTGTYTAIHGLRPTHLGLSTGTPTIASTLRDAGYTTQHIGMRPRWNNHPDNWASTIGSASCIKTNCRARAATACISWLQPT
jgi:arylsulfatase A-like enzyme